MKTVWDQINSLNSIFPWVRKRAVDNLVESGSPAVKEIISTLDTPWAPIWLESSTESLSEGTRAAKRYLLLKDVLVKIGEPAIAELENALHHPNLNVRYLSIEAISRIGHPSIVDLLLPLLDSKEYQERQAVIKALGKTGSPKAFDRIVTALDDEIPYVRTTALIALGNIGDMTVLPKLKEIAESDKTRVDEYGTRTNGDLAEEAIRKILERENK